jgi:3-oxoadipate enol-lactonase
MPRAELNTVSLHYEDSGRGEPVVFVHGGFASLAGSLLDPEELAWGEWERDFAAQFRFVTYDRRGCGRSSCPSDGYELSNQAVDLAELLDHLSVESAHVIGSSAGGPIAIAFAALHPRRARSLVLVGTGLDLFRSDEPGSADAIVKREIARLETDGPETAFVNRPPEAEVWLEPLWMTAEAKERGELESFEARERRLAARAAKVPVAERIARYAAELRDIRAYVDCDGRDFARSVEAPTLVIHGELDRAVPVDWGRELAETIRGASFHLVRDGSHGLLWRSTEAHRVIQRFIAAATGSG